MELFSDSLLLLLAVGELLFLVITVGGEVGGELSPSSSGLMCTKRYSPPPPGEEPGSELKEGR